MSESEKIETQIVADSSSTALALKRSADQMLRESVAPKIERLGKVNKVLEVDTAALGGSLIVSGKLVAEHKAVDDRTASKTLLEGGTLELSVKLAPGSKVRLWTDDEFCAGPVRADGLGGPSCVIVRDGVAFVGGAQAGVGGPKGRVHTTNGVFSGAVNDCKPDGRGMFLSGNHLIRGSFAQGLPDGRVSVTDVDTKIRYLTSYESGIEMLHKRKSSKTATISEYDDEDEDDDDVEAMKAKIETLSEKVKTAESAPVDSVQD